MTEVRSCRRRKPSEPCLLPKIDQREIERAGGEALRRKFVSISEMLEALD